MIILLLSGLADRNGKRYKIDEPWKTFSRGSSSKFLILQNRLWKSCKTKTCGSQTTNQNSNEEKREVEPFFRVKVINSSLAFLQSFKVVMKLTEKEVTPLRYGKNLSFALLTFVEKSLCPLFFQIKSWIPFFS